MADFAEAERSLWWGISSRNFSKRQLRVLKFILKQSFGRSRGKAYVASLEAFDEYTRLGVSHVSEVLTFLKRAKVIREYPEHCYGFLFPVKFWDVPELPEKMYHEDQIELIEAPADLFDALSEVFIDDARNLPTRGPVRGAVHPDRSRTSSGPSSPTGGVVSRESVGSVPDYQAVVEPGGKLPLSRQAISPQGREGSEPIPKPGNAPDFPNRETFPESGNVNQNPCKMATASAFPESGSGVAYASDVTEMFVQKDIPACTTSFPESGNATKLDPERQELLNEVGKSGAFGLQDHAKGFWLNFVRRRPLITRELLAELRYRRQTHPSDPVRYPGKWMVDKWKRWGRPTR